MMKLRHDIGRKKISLFRILLDYFGRFDLLPVLASAVLLAFGVFFVYGTGHQVGGINTVFWKLHLHWIIFGCVLWFIFSQIDYKFWGPLSLVCYPVGLLLLVYVLFFGVKRFSARRWIDLFGTSFQPSEFAKEATVLLIAWLLTLPKFDIRKWRTLLTAGILAALPAALVFLQPNLSTALTILLACGAVIFVAGVPLRVLLIGMISLAVLIPCAYPMLKPYHRERIAVFLSPGRDIQGKGWNQRQAELAVGSGGFSGKGFMQGTQNELGYLPQTVSNSDFIFSVIAEETGFLGSLLLLLMYALLIASIFRTACLTNDPFGRNICVGIGTIVSVHTIVNIGMSIRLTPVTGIPLPLVSYGGTFMVAMLSSLGIVQSVYARRKLYSEEKD